MVFNSRNRNSSTSKIPYNRQVESRLSDNSEKDEQGQRSVGCLSARHTLAAILSLGLAIAYIMRFNLSVALVAMVGNRGTPKVTGHNSTDTGCPRLNTTTANHTAQGEFDWDPETQGLILGSFFYGYVVLQIPGAWLATRFGAKYLIGGSIFLMSILTLLTPIAARAHVGVLITVRALEGLAGGCLFPCVHTILGHWAPMNERSKLITLISSGVYMGNVVAYATTGLLCEQPFLGGWPSTFYIPGVVGCLWFIAWLYLAYDSPSKHPRISAEECRMINDSVGENIYKDVPVPWVAMLTSPPFWAVCFAFTCSGWGTYTLMIELPSYIKHVIGVDVSQSGLLSALPFALSAFSSFGWGYMADTLIERKVLATTKVRKLMNTIGTLFPAAMLVLSNFVGCNQYVVIGVIATAQVFQTADISAGNANMIDMAPHLAGLIKSVANTFTTLTGIASPYLAGVLVSKGETKSDWAKVFYVTAGILVADCIVYFIFASSEQQPWSRVVTEIYVTQDSVHVQGTDSATEDTSPTPKHLLSKDERKE